ncbi:MAG: pyridoxamine 5'-phosphate oxidase family protein [Syntrophorhabdaceae bacterium]|nr:pyridoxamine 5'-phosphate oxidase family protein [Syntrophorhabdaceae bacterium]
MKLSEYFENTQGRGVLATADSKGFVDVAVYSRPHFIDEETIAYIMTGKLTHENLKTNPHAAYLFMEAGEKFKGKRLYLTKIKEETDPEAIEKIRWRKSYKVPDDQKDETRYLVFFHIDKVLPLIGDKE